MFVYLIIINLSGHVQRWLWAIAIVAIYELENVLAGMEVTLGLVNKYVPFRKVVIMIFCYCFCFHGHCDDSDFDDDDDFGENKEWL